MFDRSVNRSEERFKTSPNYDMSFCSLLQAESKLAKPQPRDQPQGDLDKGAKTIVWYTPTLTPTKDTHARA
jgi:hypothetical protein